MAGPLFFIKVTYSIIICPVARSEDWVSWVKNWDMSKDFQSTHVGGLAVHWLRFHYVIDNAVNLLIIKRSSSFPVGGSSKFSSGWVSSIGTVVLQYYSVDS